MWNENHRHHLGHPAGSQEGRFAIVTERWARDSMDAILVDTARGV